MSGSTYKPTSGPIVECAVLIQQILFSDYEIDLPLAGIAEYVADHNAFVARVLGISERWSLKTYMEPEEVAAGLAKGCEQYKTLTAS